ncbi:MAG: T9SS type A sorting domain-containing protein [Bacteroidia bacterium]
MKTITTTLLFALHFTVAFSQSKIVASDRMGNNYFGESTAVFGNYLITGASFHTKDASGGNTLAQAGAAYIYENDGGGNWIEKQKVVASDRNVQDWFGFSVAIQNNIALVGTILSDTDENGANPLTDSGATYVFERDASGNWNQVQKLVASDRQGDEHFGYHIAMHGNFAVISARNSFCANLGGGSDINAGAAYVFERLSDGTWVERQKLMSSDREEGDNFGVSVGIYNNIIVIGAYWEAEDETGNNSLYEAGSAYIFEYNPTLNEWEETQKIVASDRRSGDSFGGTLYINEFGIFISSSESDYDETGVNYLKSAGAVYVFEKNTTTGTWEETQKLVASDRGEMAWFGYALSSNQEYLYIGASLEDKNEVSEDSLEYAGAVYIFKKDGSNSWQQIKKIVAPDRSAGDEFGYSLGAYNDNIVVGAPYQDKDANNQNNVTNAGAAYVYNISELLSTRDVSTTLNMTVYPNPNNGNFNLELGKRINGSLTITDVLGKVRHTETFISDNLNINLGLPKGIYFANVRTDEGSSAVKFVVE